MKDWDYRVDVSAQVQALFYVRVEEFSPLFLTIPSRLQTTGTPVLMSRQPAYTFGIALPASEYVLSGVIPVQATAFC